MKTLSYIEEFHPHLIQTIVLAWKSQEPLPLLEQLLLQDIKSNEELDTQTIAEVIFLIDVEKEKTSYNKTLTKHRHKH